MIKIHYSHCPVCNSTDIAPLFDVKDQSVSKETFTILQCNNCTLRFTQDAPAEQDILPYYQSPDYISHSNTSKGIINQLYQLVRKYTLQTKAKLVIKYTGKKGKILDLGAGIGAFLQTMEKSGWEAKGIEPDAGARQQALSLYNIRLDDLQGFQNLPPASFTAITMWHVLEHVHELHPYVEQLKNLLTENGRLFIAVPNYQSLDATIYQDNWAAYDVPRHLYHFTPKALETLVNKHGMKLIAKKPMWFDSYYISLISSRYRNGKTNFLAALVNGIRSNIKAAANNDLCSSVIYIISKD